MMSIFSKSRTLAFCILILSLSACHKKDPIIHNNRAFLSRYAPVINRAKAKHKKIAREAGIYYEEIAKIKNDSYVDERRYSINDKRGGLSVYRFDRKKYDARNIETANDSAERSDFKYEIPEEIRLYRDINGNLIDTEGKIFSNTTREIYFVKDNYGKYKKTGVSFDDIQPSEASLYGELSARKEKQYRNISYDILQINYDYIDVSERIKKEIYLEQEKARKNSKQGLTDNLKKQGNSLKNRFLNLFKRS